MSLLPGYLPSVENDTMAAKSSNATAVEKKTNGLIAALEKEVEALTGTIKAKTKQIDKLSEEMTFASDSQNAVSGLSARLADAIAAEKEAIETGNGLIAVERTKIEAFTGMIAAKTKRIDEYWIAKTKHIAEFALTIKNSRNERCLSHGQLEGNTMTAKLANTIAGEKEAIKKFNDLIAAEGKEVETLTGKIRSKTFHISDILVDLENLNTMTEELVDTTAVERFVYKSSRWNAHVKALSVYLQQDGEQVQIDEHGNFSQSHEWSWNAEGHQMVFGYAMPIENQNFAGGLIAPQ